MTKKRAIAAGDHGAGIPEQGFDGMAGGGCLPVVTVECAGPKHDLRDLLLGGAVAVAVEALQHPARPHALLRRQARVRRNCARVEDREQAADRFQPVEPFDAERNEGSESGTGRSNTGAHELDALSVAEVIEENGVAAVVRREARFDRRIVFSACGKNGWRLSKDDGACVFLREPN